jgi:hypothetical protein
VYVRVAWYNPTTTAIGLNMASQPTESRVTTFVCKMRKPFMEFKSPVSVTPKKWHNAKKDGKPPEKTGKTKGKKDKPATAFDPNDPGKHLTSKAWRALTKEQKTDSREAHANQKRSCGSVTCAFWKRSLLKDGLLTCSHHHCCQLPFFPSQ